MIILKIRILNVLSMTGLGINKNLKQGHGKISRYATNVENSGYFDPVLE